MKLLLFKRKLFSDHLQCILKVICKEFLCAAEEKRCKDMRDARFYFALLIMVIILMNACAKTTPHSVWINDAYSDVPLKKILVISIDKSLLNKKLIEDEFVLQLNSKGVRAIPGYTVFEYYDEILDESSIIDKVKELETDAVLISQLADTSEVEAYKGPINPYRSDIYRYYSDCCVTISLGYNIVIETKIFNAKYDTVIWSSITEAVFDVSPEVTIKKYIPLIVKDLLQKGII
jgi:hypothetical protein